MMSSTLAAQSKRAGQYAREGYVIVRGLFTADDLAPVIAESERLLARKDLIDLRNLRCR